MRRPQPLGRAWPVTCHSKDSKWSTGQRLLRFNEPFAILRRLRHNDGRILSAQQLYVNFYIPTATSLPVVFSSIFFYRLLRLDVSLWSNVTTNVAVLPFYFFRPSDANGAWIPCWSKARKFEASSRYAWLLYHDRVGEVGPISPRFQWHLPSSSTFNPCRALLPHNDISEPMYRSITGIGLHRLVSRDYSLVLVQVWGRRYWEAKTCRGSERIG